MSNSRRVALLEAQLRRQAAEIGELRDAAHRLSHDSAVVRAERDEARGERDALRIELAQVRAELEQTRQQHADTKRQMGELVQALANRTVIASSGMGPRSTTRDEDDSR